MTKTCGDCAFWHTPKCTFSSDQTTLRKGDVACSEFYQCQKSKEKPKKKQLKDSGSTVDGCFEAVYVDGKPFFLLKNSETFNIVETVELNGETFYPKEAKNVPYEPYGFYEGSVPNREELFCKVRAEFDTWIDVEPIWKDVLAACVMLTYQQQKLQTVPYIFPFGDNESGKTTIFNVMNALCYRPLFGLTVPSADIYGYLEDSDSTGCILEDEVQGIYKDVDKIKIYKGGYKRGAKVPRTIITQNDRTIKYYPTFCFKACASEQIPQVKGFRERFIEISMVEGSPEKEWADINKEDQDRLHNLRNMLLKWRMLSREWDLPSVELNMKGRLKELWKPILEVTSGLTVYDGLFKFVEEQRKERLSVRQDSLEGKIVKVVVEILNEAKDSSSIPFHTIWSWLQDELDGKIDDKKPHVMDTSEFFQVTKNRVGYRLREVLSGKTKVLREKDAYGNWISTKAYEFDVSKLRRVAMKYGYELVTKLPSLLSSGSVQPPERMEKTCADNVEREAHTPEQLGKLSNSVTSEKEPSKLSVENSSIFKDSKYKNTEGKSCSNSVTTEALRKEKEAT